MKRPSWPTAWPQAIVRAVRAAMGFRQRWQAPGTRSSARLVVHSSADSFTFVEAGPDGRLRRCGQLLRGEASPPDFTRRLRALQLPPVPTTAVLLLADGQLVQTEAPAVRTEEMQAAARWKVKDLVVGRVDELTMDVMFVGDERPRAKRSIFVAAARTSLITELAERTSSAGLQLAVVELTETAQRNLHAAMAAAEGLQARATAALVRHGSQCLLTVCCEGELFYARRLSWTGLPQSEPNAQKAQISQNSQAAQTGAPASTATRTSSLALEALDATQTLEEPNFVDYGAEAEPSALPGAETAEAPAMVIELQRSFDVWERSWPDLPLAALWVEVGAESPALARLLQQALAQRVAVLEPQRIVPGWAEAAPDPAWRDTLLPLLGGLLRQDKRKP